MNDIKLLSSGNFLELLPDRTSSFVENVSDYISEISANENYFKKLNLESNEVDNVLEELDEEDNRKVLIFLFMLAACSKIDDCKSIFFSNGIRNDFTFQSSRYNPTPLYNYRYVFDLNLKNYSYYKISSPFDFVINYMEKTTFNSKEDVIYLVLKKLGCIDPNKFKKDIMEHAKTIEKINLSKIEKKIFVDTSIVETKSYLEYLGKVYSVLTYLKDVSNYKYKDDNLGYNKVLSILLAYFYYKDENKNINVKEKLISKFNLCGLTPKNLFNNLGISFTKESLDHVSRKDYILSMYDFVKSSSNVNVENFILTYLINDKDNKNLLTEILNDINVDYEVINDAYNEITLERKNCNKLSLEEYNKDLTPNDILFFYDTTRIYQYLLKINETKQIDNVIIQNINDYKILAVLIQIGFMSSF